MLDPKFTKPVSGFLYIYEENEIPASLSGTNVSFTLCDRNDTTSKLGNYFISLNLPWESSALPTNQKLSIFYPELQQLNVDKIILVKIPYDSYTEFIDGRSVELNVPIRTVNPHDPFTTGQSTTFKLLSSTYNGVSPNKYGESSPLLGDNVAFLFCDNINLPYTGYTLNEIELLQSHSNVVSWNPLTRSYKNRPSAVSYAESKLSNDTINTDRRLRINKATFIDGLYPDYRGEGLSYYGTYDDGGKVGLITLPNQNYFNIGDTVTIDEFDHNWNSGYTGYTTILNISTLSSYGPFSYAPNTSYTGPWDLITIDINWGFSGTNESGTLYAGIGTYYNYDIPAGFVVLDKGLIAITHPDIVNNVFWQTGYTQDGSLNTGVSTTDIYFLNQETTIYGDVEPASQLKFTSLDTVFKLRATCNSTIGEFYISNNSTWPRNLANNVLSQNENVKISEVGLYNELNELIGMAKFSEPISKSNIDLLTFEIDINL